MYKLFRIYTGVSIMYFSVCSTYLLIEDHKYYEKIKKLIAYQETIFVNNSTLLISIFNNFLLFGFACRMIKNDL